jgi:hypothetical protein
MPGLRREFQKNDRLATHTALGELFIPDEFGKCKRVFMELSRAARDWTAEAGCPHASNGGGQEYPPRMHLVEFQGDELGWMVAYVGQGVGVAAGEPLHVAGFENAWHGALTYDIAAHLQVGYRDQQVRAGMVMARHGGAGLQLGLGDTDAVLNEDDVLRASGEDVEAAFFVPLRRRRLAGGFVLQKFDSHVAERGVGQIAGDVGEVAGHKTGFTILQVKRDGRLALDVVLGLRGAERDEDVIVVMGVHESRVMGWDLHLEHADVFVFEGEVVMRLGGEFDLGSILRGQSDGCE